MNLMRKSYVFWGGFSVDSGGQPCLGDLKIRTTFFVDGCPPESRLSAAVILFPEFER
jgi:hypothetical protein